MPISSKAIKLLWGNAAGRCSFIGCDDKLCLCEDDGTAPYTIGEMAHIKGEKLGSNRHDPKQPLDERDSYSNLILLCPNHHTIIDRKENESIFSVDILQQMKSTHEERIRDIPKSDSFVRKQDVATFVYPLMKQNYEAFINFGPRSEIARKNPFSDAHKMWLSERLSTILPNNRSIQTVIASNSNLFAADEQAILARFGMHVRSYERWANDEISYEAVIRFPPDFETLIEGLVHDSLQ
jgi:hypothetical protein